MSEPKKRGHKNTGEIFHRSLSIESFEKKRTDGDESKEVYEFKLSSEEPVEVWYRELEILSHAPEAVRMEFISSGNAPLLWMHDRGDPRGILPGGRLEGGNLIVMARFGESKKAKEIKKDVDAGIIKNVSVGYLVHAYRFVEERSDGFEVFEATDWEPLEASFVTIPADKTVGMGRSRSLKDLLSGDDKTEDTPEPEPTRHQQPWSSSRISRSLVRSSRIGSLHGVMNLVINRAFRAIPFAFLSALLSPASALESPSGKYDFQLTLEEGRASYSVTYNGQKIIEHSALGFQLESGKVLGRGVDVLTASEAREVETSWKPVYGERADVADHYRTQSFALQAGGPVAMTIEVRCYDEGVAFCYQLQGKDPNREVHLVGEKTEFSFSADHETWTATSAQGYYSKRTISQMESSYERPQLFYAEAGDLYLALGEARLVDFSRMRLKGSKVKKNTVMADLSGSVKFTGKMTSPWRFVMAAKQPSELLEHNDFLLNLNDPCEIKDTSWIKPGKVLRDVRMTNEGSRRAIDFAAENGIAFVHFDAGWYGHEYDKASDATTDSLDPKRTKGPFDLQNLVKYAKERGVGITVYVNQRALTKQLDVILPLYQKWGIAGVKYGFVKVGSQEATTWLHEAVRKAADHKLMVDIHDEYRPTGYSRTYPNLMTQEGIGGDETAPSADQTLGIFFPRYLAGAADHTVCYFTERVVDKVNHAFQLGKTVCCYSPWQFIYWYDAPSAGRDGGPPIMGRNEPELEFFKNVPTVWDESRVLEGRIGEFVVMARRSGEEWFLGAMNGSESTTTGISLDFLDREKTYLLRSYTHDDSIPTQTKVRVGEKMIKAGDVLKLALKMNDGAAFRIMPRDE